MSLIFLIKIVIFVYRDLHIVSSEDNTTFYSIATLFCFVKLIINHDNVKSTYKIKILSLNTYECN